jgi:class 3 adenylate cyclase
MDIVVWLRSLGLEQYETAFRENAITEKLLPTLTAEDFKDLGVLVVGHRRALLNAVADLRSNTNAESAPLSAFATAAAPAKDTAERRQVTVMFSDLVGSTALSARMDPEDLREVISAYQKCVSETVARFGGYVAKYMGDGVLIYFGYPQAQEDDAERAVRAGLELIAVVTKLKAATPLQTRVGIATGMVVVGNLIGAGESQERGIVGETPNLAARLQGMAEPNMVVLAEGTRILLGNLFELKDLGTKNLKGITEAVRAWAALRPAAVESRFEALHATGMTDLVGREEELELLLRRWSKAKTGEGQVVLLCGEAGIGKSRIIAALRDRLLGKPHTQLRYFCSPQHKDSPLYPIIGQMQHAAGLRHEDSQEAKLDKLDAMLAQTRTPTEDAALFAEMLSLANDGRYPALPSVPQQRREKTLKALISQVELLERDSPVLMIFEDAHWSDPTSLEAFGRAVDRIATLRVLLIVTFRPEFEAPWIGRAYVTTININRLSKREIVDMIGRVVGNKFLPENLREDIIERTDGIPLFVEEITKAVMEAESEGKARQAVSVVPAPTLNVPATLQASLMARLDRLGAAKEVAQTGAAIGREFSHGLLAAVACKPEEQLALSLDRLAAAGLLFRHGVPPHATYVFKHVLIRDAAYSTLLRSRRHDLHRQIVSVLQREFPELVVSQPELLAHHCAEAGMIAEAIEYCLLAAQRATAASNNTEKIAHIARGITLVEQLSSSDQRAADFRIRLTLGGAGFLW